MHFELFHFDKKKKLKKTFLVCPTPVPVWVVVTSIVGAIVGLGLLVLLAIKIIILIIQRVEYKNFVNKIKNQAWGQVSYWYC